MKEVHVNCQGTHIRYEHRCRFVQSQPHIHVPNVHIKQTTLYVSDCLQARVQHVLILLLPQFEGKW